MTNRASREREEIPRGIGVTLPRRLAIESTILDDPRED
jgi:hypothetical protein